MTRSKYAAMTGRVERYEQDVLNAVPLNKRLFPASCTVYIWQDDLDDLMRFTSGALRHGAGVKFHIPETYTLREPTEGKEWYFMLDKKHPDYNKIQSLPTAIRTRFIDRPSFENHFEKNDEACYRLIKVFDSMTETAPGYDSIEKSWETFRYALANDYVPIVDLSAIRPAGTPSGSNKASKQLVATGALGFGNNNDGEEGSFVSIYSRIFNWCRSGGDIIDLLQLLGQLNRTLLQGREKTGIVCTGIHYKSEFVNRYLSYPLAQLIGSQKKAIRMDVGVLDNAELVELICEKVNTESVFLEKIRPDGVSNVCGEIILQHKQTCNLHHINAGMIEKPSDIPQAMAEVMEELCHFWETWRDNVDPVSSAIYVSKNADRQVGLGWIGWANFLGRQGVTYQQFTDTLEDFLDDVEAGKHFQAPKNLAQEICFNLYAGYARCNEIAQRYDLDRAFTTAPCQNLFQKTKDLDGRICSRGLVAPFVKRVRRVSERKQDEFKILFHGNNVQVAAEVGAAVHERLHDQWQRLMETTGRAHTITYDLWHYIDPTWLRKFILDMNLWTTYYNFTDQVDPRWLDKGQVMAVDVSKEMNCGCAE